MDKSQARKEVWIQLIKVALPDSRFHYDFESFIPDFLGSDDGVRNLTSQNIYQDARLVFITPDNCLEGLRLRALRDGKLIIVPSYAILRGFYALNPRDVPAEDYRFAATLDGMETAGQPISLAQLQEMGQIDLVVTGASAISRQGVRFGKGHGFFDLEWAILYKTGTVSLDTPVVAFVHDCQVVDTVLEPTEFDSVCDLIVTPKVVIKVENPHKPTVGVVWDRLEEGMLESIPPLKELRDRE